jgi:hypothetical protein
MRTLISGSQGLRSLYGEELSAVVRVSACGLGEQVTQAHLASGILQRLASFYWQGLSAALPANQFATIQQVDQVSAALNVRDFGAKGDGRSTEDGAMTSGQAVLTSATAEFSSADVGKYVSVAGAGTLGAGLGTTIASVQGPTSATLSAASSATISNAQLEIGTDAFDAIQSAATAICSKGGTLVFPPGTYVIGRHKAFSGSATNYVGDINWSGCTGVTISGYGATIYIDGSFHQYADGVREKSNENALTPFSFRAANNVTIKGVEINGNKNLITKDAGVTTESLTSYGIAFTGGGNQNYSIRDVYIHEVQTDAIQIGNSSTGTDYNVVIDNTRAINSGRGNLSIENVVGLTVTNSTLSGAGTGSYGGYQPMHGVDIEPGVRADNLTFDNITSTNNKGWQFTVASAALTNSVVITASDFSWTKSYVQQGFNVGSNVAIIDNNRFTIGTASAVNNIITPAHGSGVTLSQWCDNVVTSTIGGRLRAPIFSSGFDADGSLNPIDLTNNTFNVITGNFINARNLRLFQNNHIFVTTNGTEMVGNNIITNLEGSQSVVNNDYSTDLTAFGIYFSTYYLKVTVVSNETFPNAPHYQANCAGSCSGTAMVGKSS